MDLRHYFSKIREIESSIAEQDVFVVSLATQDGGKAGVITEVPRFVAAKLIAEGRSARASAEQEAEFLLRQAEGREAAQRLDAARRLQVTIVSDAGREKPNSGTTQSVKK